MSDLRELVKSRDALAAAGASTAEIDERIIEAGLVSLREADPAKAAQAEPFLRAAVGPLRGRLLAAMILRGRNLPG